MSELFDAVDALVASRSPLPPPAERKRLRQAHGLTLEEVATALDVRRATVGAWESGKTEPRPPQREPYARLLQQLAQLYPAPAATSSIAGSGPLRAAPAAAAPAEPAVPAGSARDDAGEVTPAPAAATGVPAQSSADTPPPAAAPRPAPGSRPPGAPKAAAGKAPAPARSGPFEHGPLLVLDADDGRQVTGYGTGGLLLDVPAKSLSALVEWALAEARVGAVKLHPSGKDADPLLVLTAAACERYGLPATLSDAERSAGRLPEDHKAVKLLERAGWQLTRRGLGPWARIYRPVTGGRRQCVQLCIPSWNALDDRAWGHAATLEPAELARVLGVYADRVMTPVGSTAVTGLELHRFAINPEGGPGAQRQGNLASSVGPMPFESDSKIFTFHGTQYRSPQVPGKVRSHVPRCPPDPPKRGQRRPTSRLGSPVIRRTDWRATADRSACPAGSGGGQGPGRDVVSGGPPAK